MISKSLLIFPSICTEQKHTNVGSDCVVRIQLFGGYVAQRRSYFILILFTTCRNFQVAACCISVLRSSFEVVTFEGEEANFLS